MNIPQINIKNLAPKKTEIRQVVTMLVGAFVALIVFQYLFSRDDGGAKDIYEKTNELLEQQIEELKEEIVERERAYELRQDSLLILENELMISKMNQRKLKNELYNAKKKLQSATDSDNVDFYIDYINEYRTNKE